MSCQHVMISGKNKGSTCPKRSTTVTIGLQSYKIQFCFDHKDAHEEEWRPNVTEKHSEKMSAMYKKKEAFEKSLESRKIDHKFFRTKMAIRESCMDFVQVLGEKDKNEDIIGAVDNILLNIALANRSVAGYCGQLSFTLFPCQQRGYTMEELAPEFQKRGFKITHKNTWGRNDFCVEIVYLD